MLVVSSKSGAHGGDRQPPAHLRRGLRRRRDRRGDAGSSWSPTRARRSRTSPARRATARSSTADPHVGGRYSALTAFGLVPAGLAGADIARAARRGRAARPRAVAPTSPDNPAMRAGRRARPRPTRAARRRSCSPTPAPASSGFGDWAEQLIAESTGKQGTGLLPVVVEGPHAPGFADAEPDATPVAVGPGDRGARRSRRHGPARRAVPALGVRRRAGRPAARHQPVRPARRRGGEEGRPRAAGRPEGADRPEDAGGRDRRRRGVRRRWATAHGTGTLAEVLREFVGDVADDGYLAVQAYLDRLDDASATVLRGELAQAHRACRRRSAGARGSCTPPASTTRAATRTAASCRSRARSPTDLAGAGPPVHPRHACSARRRSATARCCAEHGAGPCCGCT